MAGVLVFALIYASLGLLGEWYRPQGWDLPLVGLQTTFLQLCLVILGIAWWPHLILVSLLVKVAAFYVGTRSFSVEAILTIADMVNALGGAWVARFMLSNWAGSEYRRLFLTFFSCALVGPLLGVSVSHASVGFVEGTRLLSPSFGSTLLSGVLGAVILAPFPLAWAHSCQAEWRGLVVERRIEAIVVALVVPLFALYVACLQPEHGVDMGALMLVPIMVCAMRFDFPGAAYACAIGLLVILGVSASAYANMPDAMLFRIQALGCLVSVSGLAVAGQLERQKRAARQLMGLSESTTELVASFEFLRDDNGVPCDLRFLEINPAFTLITGYSREIAVGARATQLYGVPVPPHMHELMLMMKHGRAISFETFLPKAKRHLKATAFPTDRRNRFSIVATDVTELRQREVEVLMANRMYAVLSQINQAIVRSNEPVSLIESTCRAFVEEGGIALSWAVLRVGEERALSRVAIAGVPTVFADKLEELSGMRRDSLLTEICMSEDRSLVCTNFALDPMARAWGELAVAHGLHSAAAFPLRLNGEPVGAICLYAKEAGAFSTRELSLLNSAAADLSHALDNLRMESVRLRAQKELEQSEHRFRLLFEQAPVAYLAVDSAGLVTDANPAWASLVNHIPGACLGHPLVDYVRAPFRHTFTSAFESLLSGGGEKSFELEFVTAEGEFRSSILALRVELDEARRFKAGHCIIFNITDRKKYENAVRVSEQRLTQAFEIANDGIWELNLQDRSLYLSKRFYAMIGVDPQHRTLEFAQWHLLVHPDDLAAFDSAFSRFAANERGEVVQEYRIKGPRNRWIWVLTRARIVERDASAAPLRVLGTISDITERRNAEESLRETALKYRSYIDESPMAICLISADGSLLETNPAFRQLFGLSELESEDEALSALMDPVSVEGCNTFVDLLSTKSRGEAELRGRRRKGGVLFLSLQAVGLTAGRFLVFCLDTTGRRRAELALHARESMLESILHTALDGFWIIDTKGGLIEVNETYCATSGYSQKELLQMRMSDLEAIETTSALQQHLARIRRQGSERWETSHRRKDGSLIDVEISATYLPVEDGRYVVFLQNITDRKKAETALRQSQRQLALIIEGSSLAAWDWDLKTGEVFFNSHWGRMLGYADAECSMKRQVWLDLIHPEDQVLVAEALRKHLEGEIAYFDCEYRVRRHDESWLWIMDRGQVISKDSSGRPLRATGTQRDIHARKLAEDRVRQQAALLDQTQDIIIAADTAGIIRLCNRTAEEFFGLSSHKLEGRSLMEMLHEAEPMVTQAMIDDILLAGEWVGEIRFGSPTQQDRIWDSRWSVVRSPEGVVQNLLVVGTDVSEKRMLESRFLRSQRMESIGAIASGVAHDLNNIFLPISLAANMLRTSQDPEQRVSLHQMIDQSAQRGAEVVRQLLTFGRGMDGRRIELQPSLLLHEVRRILIETFPKNISTDCQVAEELWTIHADPTQIHQVLLNLCVNARDAMPEGGVLTLAAENVVFDEYYAAMNPEAEQGPYIVLQVGDTGVGISAEHLDKIFDPFFTTKAPGTGTGLGLSTVHGIVKGCGGFIQVRSQLGQGSVFKVYLPAIPKPVEVHETLEREEPLPGNGELILVVDDEEAVRQSLKHLLEIHGYRCMTAADGRQGMVCFVQGRERIRAIVTDIMMPVMDGTELIRAVRRLSPDVPILAMSGLPEKESAVTMSEGHADIFLVKPFVSEQLLRALGDALRRSTGAGGAPANEEGRT